MFPEPMCDRLFLLTASPSGVSTSDQALLPCDKLSSPPLSSLFVSFFFLDSPLRSTFVLSNWPS